MLMKDYIWPKVRKQVNRQKLFGENYFVTRRYSVNNILYTDTGDYFYKDLLHVPALNYQ